MTTKIVEKRKLEIKRLENEMLVEIKKGLSGHGDINKFHELQNQWRELSSLEIWRLTKRWIQFKPPANSKECKINE